MFVFAVGKTNIECHVDLGKQKRERINTKRATKRSKNSFFADAEQQKKNQALLCETGVSDQLPT